MRLAVRRKGLLREDYHIWKINHEGAPPVQRSSMTLAHLFGYPEFGTLSVFSSSPDAPHYLRDTDLDYSQWSIRSTYFQFSHSSHFVAA